MSRVTLNYKLYLNSNDHNSWQGLTDLCVVDDSEVVGCFAATTVADSMPGVPLNNDRVLCTRSSGIGGGVRAADVDDGSCAALAIILIEPLPIRTPDNPQSQPDRGLHALLPPDAVLWQRKEIWKDTKIEVWASNPVADSSCFNNLNFNSKPYVIQRSSHNY